MSKSHTINIMISFVYYIVCSGLKFKLCTSVFTIPHAIYKFQCNIKHSSLARLAIFEFFIYFLLVFLYLHAPISLLHLMIRFNDICLNRSFCQINFFFFEFQNNNKNRTLCTIKYSNRIPNIT